MLFAQEFLSISLTLILLLCIRANIFPQEGFKLFHYIEIRNTFDLQQEETREILKYYAIINHVFIKKNLKAWIAVSGILISKAAYILVQFVEILLETYPLKYLD